MTRKGTTAAGSAQKHWLLAQSVTCREAMAARSILEVLRIPIGVVGELRVDNPGREVWSEMTN